MTSLLPHCDAKCHHGRDGGACRCRSCVGLLHGKGPLAPHYLAALLERRQIHGPDRTFALNALADLGIQVGQPTLPGMENLT